ncbi:hypothetical protein GcM3_201002 [Golovinomyces cichoracearum]|uniref:Large ribosomal subunit protein bL33m n=1 Tax=Golovinomyces cichoracearum TaxID=62708 RepID=A0A420HDI6_9PEZI|nr:hypothetical protein GcM3_201002 [Golovinomyces cichoracearum]
MAKKPKSRTIAVRLISMAMTGYYKTLVRPRTHRPLSMLKYDPVESVVLRAKTWWPVTKYIQKVLFVMPEVFGDPLELHHIFIILKKKQPHLNSSLGYVSEI